MIRPTYVSRHLTAILFLASALSIDSQAVIAADSALPEFDFREAGQVQAWRPLHDVKSLKATPNGMAIEISGDDPYLEGPVRDYPADQPLVMQVRITAPDAGWGQIYFYQKHATEAQSVRFPVPAGGPRDLAVYLPPLGPGYRLRFDPPGSEKPVVLERLAFVPRQVLAAPAWLKPRPRAVASPDLTITSGQLGVAHTNGSDGEDFAVSWRGRVIATHHNEPLIGYLDADKPVWFNQTQSSAKATIRKVGRGIETVVEQRDPGGANWRMIRTYTPDGDSAVDVRITVKVDQPRDVIYLPLLMLLAQDEAAPVSKQQALLAGVEYLDDEPSSSTADLEGPEASRSVPYAGKLTFPLMAVQRRDHYVGLIWWPSPDIAPLFDTPDRIFQSGSDLMGLIAPGASQAFRVDGELLPVRPLRISPDKTLTARATLIAGAGNSIVPAVQLYVQRQGLPPLPASISRDAYVEQAAHGWLDTAIHEDGRFRHALGNGFQLQQAGDAAWMVEWLAGLTRDPALRERLQKTHTRALEHVPAGHEYHSAVGHLRLPVLGLVSDRSVATIEQARQTALATLKQFDADGVARYHPPAQGIDYSRTQPSREASGLAALSVAQLLQAALYSGDVDAIHAGIDRLKELERYDRGVPRGAQIWEVPLHTPDILGAAHLVQAYLLGYEWTGDRAFLDRAIYWAWTGVPFIYLRKPFDGPVGAYATTPVLGATQWVAPVWIGLPVQWCGLVYAERIAQLARHDPRGPWAKLAEGIAVSAIQQCYPVGHPRQGLLPDSFQLELQLRNPADINPGTLQPVALRYLTGISAYDVRVARSTRLLIHVPGQIESLQEEGRTAVVGIRVWPSEKPLAMIHGLQAPPKLSLDGKPLAGAVRFLPESGTALVPLPRDAGQVHRLRIER